MRISDWSSDVCSADLTGAPAHTISSAQQAKASATAATGAARLSHRGMWARGSSRMAGPPAVVLERALAGHQQPEGGEIGLHGRHRRGEASAVQHRDAVADLQQLLEILGEEDDAGARSEEHTSELQSLMRISYAVFCLKKKKNNNTKRQEV